MGATITSAVFLAAILATVIYLAVTKCDAVSNSEVVTSKHTKLSKKIVLIQTMAVLLVFLSAGVGDYVWCSNSIAQKAATATLQGQLTDFILIESDMLKSVNSKDFATAKTGADDLELGWDNSAAQLKSIDKTTWTKIDGTLDEVLVAVRSQKPDAGKCGSLLNNSLSILGEANK